jgi:hypothetical protein
VDEDDGQEGALSEPLSPTDAKALIRQIIEDGTVRYSKHALDEMAHDPLGPISKVDVINVLRGGIVEPGEIERGTWRYRVCTQRLVAVVAFRDAAVVVLVTAWRSKS